jgi:hypothetical protein
MVREPRTKAKVKVQFSRFKRFERFERFKRLALKLAFLSGRKILSIL